MIQRAHFIPIGITLLSILLFSCSDTQKKSTKLKPNIVIIFTDDQGYADVGCFGAQGFQTPHLDRLANQGMKFTSFYVSEAVCSASRSSLLTGCYSQRIGIQGALNSSSKVGLNQDELTIAELLKQKDYATGIFGKWHLGHHEEFLPLQHGFDEYYGLPYSNDMWPVDYNGSPLEAGVKSMYPVLPLIDGNEKVAEVNTLEDQALLTKDYTEKALAFIKRNKDQAFFLYLAHSMPHVPINASAQFKGSSEQGLYGDVIQEIDWSVGQVLAELEKHGIRQNTLVIFTSDNGPWMNYGNHAGKATPLREGKGSMWEGGARVPCIMAWDGVIPASSQCDQIAATIDILPTIAAITDTKLPDHPIDGINILPLLKGETAAKPRNDYAYYYMRDLIAVREGDWKLVFPHTYRSYKSVEPGQDGYPGPYAHLNCGLELYNLKNDISESQDVASSNPEIVRRLKGLAEDVRMELGDALTKTRGNAIREPGRIGPKRNLNSNHLAIGSQIEHLIKPHKAYIDLGAGVLVDGKHGSYDYKDARWTGFYGQKMETIIDLGETKTLNKISAGFLMDQMSWIFLPKSISYFVSANGERFIKVAEFESETVMEMESSVSIFTEELEQIQARYIKLEAQSLDACPDWHVGKGNKAWFFIDEVVVK